MSLNFSIFMLIMAFSIAKTISFLFMLLMCTIWQMSTDQTVHLTDGGGGFKEVKILTLAQCHANNGPKETANKPYGIEFRLPRKGGNCDDGLLVCYPALLRRGNHLEKSRNFKVTRKFIVKAEMDNSLGKECVQNMPNNGHKNGTIIWRGIKLSTMPKQNDQNNGRIIILETSIVSKKHYPLGAGQLKISVLFASNQTAGNEPFTRLSSMENDFYGRSMQNDFFRSNGPSFLSDYADLWLLGLDMLPMAHQTEKQREQLKMELFISRSSKCFMEAWFVQPSHSLKPSDPKMQIAFSLCKPNPTEEQNERLFPKKVDKYVLPTGGGCSGLGNQMFRFAALYGIGKPYGRKPIYKNIDKCKKSHVNAVEKGEKKEQLFPIFAIQEKYFNPEGKQNETFYVQKLYIRCFSYENPQNFAISRIKQKYLELDCDGCFQSYKFFGRRKFGKYFNLGINF